MALTGDECGVGVGGEEDSHPGAALPCHEAGLKKQDCPARGAELSMAQGWEVLPDAGIPHKTQELNENSSL